VSPGQWWEWQWDSGVSELRLAFHNPASTPRNWETREQTLLTKILAENELGGARKPPALAGKAPTSYSARK
jgi:hypothetical protein